MPIRFMVDECVPASVLKVLTDAGHTAIYIREILPAGAADALVATIAELEGAVLVSVDHDFDKIAPRIPKGARARFKKISRISIRCTEYQAAARLESVIELIQSEYSIAAARPDVRIFIEIGTSYIKLNR